MAAKTRKSNAKSKGKSKRGGSRANAGRKPSEAKALRTQIVVTQVETPDQIAKAETALKRRLMRCFKNLFKLADGGYTRDRITREPAGLVTVKRMLMRPMIRFQKEDDGTLSEHFVRGDDGRILMEPQTDDKGRPIFADEPLYPDLPPGELVVVSHSSETADADRAANQYLIDRILGKPYAAEPPTPGENPGRLPSILESALARAYGSDDEEADPGPEPGAQLAIEV